MSILGTKSRLINIDNKLSLINLQLEKENARDEEGGLNDDELGITEGGHIEGLPDGPRLPKLREASKLSEETHKR